MEKWKGKMEGMGRLMENLKKNVYFFVKKPEYIIPLILVIILSFGFVVTHYSINVDTLSDSRYYKDGELLAQNRYGGVLIDKIFGVMEYNPFFVDGLAVIFLAMAAITFCILFKRISQDKINTVTYTIFSCLFVSSPLINEIFAYTPMSLGVCFSFFVNAIIFNLVYSYKITEKKKYLIFSTIMLCIISAIYESSVTVYLSGIIMVEILDYIYGKHQNAKYIIKNLLIMLIPLLISMIINAIISKLILIIFNLEPSVKADKKIYYIRIGVGEAIKNLLKTIFLYFGINGLLYLPITVMQISSVIMLILGIIYAKKNKNFMIFLLFLGEIISIFALSIIEGTAAKYRTCQVFQLFSAFAFMMLIQYFINADKNKIVKNIFIFLAFLIIFYQAKETNKNFYYNYVRYEQEKTYLIENAERLEDEYDIKNKPVIFIANKVDLSKYSIENLCISTDKLNVKVANFIVKIFEPENYAYDNQKYSYIYKPSQSNMYPYLYWADDAFGEPNTEIYKWLTILGYDKFIQPTMEQYYDAKSQIQKLGDIDQKIVELENYLVVLVNRRF